MKAFTPLSDFLRSKRQLSTSRSTGSHMARTQMFQLEGLESRVLMSGDPVFATAAAFLADNQNQHGSEVVRINNVIQQRDATVYREKVQQESQGEKYDIGSWTNLGASYGASLQLSENQILGGSGTIDLDITNEGTVAPGYSPGVQNITGSFSQTSTGSLEIEIGGTGIAGASDGFDQLNISSIANLGGELDIKILDGYVPKVGDSFDIITYGSFTGQFDDIQGLYGIHENLYFDLVQSADKIQLQVKEFAAWDGNMNFSITENGDHSLWTFLNNTGLSTPSGSVTLNATLDLSDQVSMRGEFQVTTLPAGDFQIYTSNGLLNVRDFITASGEFSIEYDGVVEGDINTGLSAPLVSSDLGHLQNDLDALVSEGLLSADYTRMENVQLNAIQISGSSVNVYVGTDSSFIDSNSNGVFDAGEENANAAGIKFNPMAVAMSVMELKNIDGNSSNEAVIPSLFTFKGEWDEAFNWEYGILDLEISSAVLNVNQGARWIGTSSSYGAAMDFSDAPYEVNIVNTSETLQLNASRNAIGVELNNVVMSVSDVFTISGNLALEVSEDVPLTIHTGVVGNTALLLDYLYDYSNDGGITLSNLPMNVLTLGGSDLSIKEGSVDDPLFSVNNISFGMGIFTADSSADSLHLLPPMFAFKVTIEDLPDIHWGELNLELSTVNLNLNIGAPWAFGGIPFINFNIDGGFAVNTGNGNSLIFDYGTSLLGVDLGQAQLTIGSNVHISGSLSISFLGAITVDVGTELGNEFVDVVMDGFSIGGSNINIFLGVHGPYFGEGDKGSSLGVYARDVNFAVVALRSNSILNSAEVLAQDFKTYSFHVDTKDVGIVGIEDIMTLEANGASFGYNSGRMVGNAEAYVNYSRRHPDGFAVRAGDETIKLDFDSSIIEASLTEANIQMVDFVYLSGSLAFSFGRTTTVKSDLADLKLANPLFIPFGDEQELDVTVITIGSEDLFGFAGVGGPYYLDSDGDGIKDVDASGNYIVNKDSIGLSLADADLAFTIMTVDGLHGINGKDLSDPITVAQLDPLDIALNELIKFENIIFMAGKADILSAGLVGMESVITAKVEDISLEINTGYAKSFSKLGGAALALRLPYIDFSASFPADNDKPAGFEIATGGSPVYLDFDDEIISAKVDYAELNIAGVIQGNASMAFNKRGAQTVTLSDGTTTEVTTLEVAVVNANAFVGIGGYFEDSDHDGRITANDTPDSSAIGIAIRDLDVGIVFMTEKKITSSGIELGVYTAVKARVQEAGLVGLGGVIEFEAKNLSFDFNAGLSISGGLSTVVDFSKSGEDGGNYSIDTGSPENAISFDYDHALLSLSGEVHMGLLDAINIDGYVELNLTLSSLEFQFAAQASFATQALNPITARGSLVMADGAIYGRLELGDPDSESLLVDSPVLELGGSFLLEINTSSEQKTIELPFFNENGEVEKEIVRLNASILHIAGQATVSVAGFIEMKGSVDLLIEGPTIALEVDLSLSMGFFGSLNVSGAGFLGYVDGEGVVFALRIEAGVKALNLGLIKIEAGVGLYINTSYKNEYAGVAPSTFKIGFDGEATMVVWKGEFKGSVGVENGHFELRIDKYEISYFGVVTLNVNGYIRSASDFFFEAEATMGVDLGILELTGRIYIAVGNNGFAAEISGELVAKINVGFFNKRVTLAGFSAGISYWHPKMKMSISVTVLGFTVKGSRTWSLGSSPVDETSVSMVVDHKYLNQEDEDVLDVTILGTKKGEEYTVHEVEKTANLNGKLALTIGEEYEAKVGDTFDIIDYSKSNGAFDVATGIYGIKGDYYFELINNKDKKKFQLVVRELVEGDDFEIIGNNEEANTAIGRLANRAYFGDDVVTVDARVTVSDQVYASGSIQIGSSDGNTILSDGTSVTSENWTFTSRNVSLFFGANALEYHGDDLPTVGLLSSSGTMGAVLTHSTKEDDKRSWVSIEATMAENSIGFEGMPYAYFIDNEQFLLSGTKIFGENEVGVENNTYVNYAQIPVILSDELGNLVAFDHTADQRDSFTLEGGTASFVVDDYQFSGDYSFSTVADVYEDIENEQGQTTKELIRSAGIVGTGSNVEAAIALDDIGMRIGANAKSNFGIAFTGQGVAIEAAGESILEGGLFYDTTAERSSVSINRTGHEYTGVTIKTSKKSYRFNVLEASTNLNAVGIEGLNGQLAGIFSISGDFGFKADKSISEISIIAKNANIEMGAGDYVVGVKNAFVGLVHGKNGTALEASSNELYAQLGSKVEISANKTAVMWNTTGEDFIGKTITTAGVSYTYERLYASSLLQEIRVDDAHILFDDFVRFDGSFGFTKNVDGKVNVAEAGVNDAPLVEIDAEILSIGALDVTAFVGTNYGQSNMVGLHLEEVDFALLIANEVGVGSYYGLKADVHHAEFVGLNVMPEGFEADISDVIITINTTLDDNGTSYAMDFSEGYEVATGVTSSITFDMRADQGELLQAAATIDLSFNGFFSASGSFGFQKYTDHIEVVHEDNTVEAVTVDLITFGASEVNAFAGRGEGTENAQGFALSGINLAVAVMSEQKDDGRVWTALDANSSSFEVIGFDSWIDGVSVDFAGVGFVMNRSSKDGSVVDFAGANSLDIWTGPHQTVTFDMSGYEGDAFQVYGHVDLNLFNTLELSGGFSYKGSDQLLVLSSGDAANEEREIIQAQMTSLGLVDVSGFMGVRGSDPNSTDDDTGLILENIDLAFASFSDKNSARSWTSLQANVGLATIAGWSEDIGISLSSTTLVMNTASNDGKVIDYSYQDNEAVLEFEGQDIYATELTLTVGSNAEGQRETVTFNMDDGRGDLFQLSGYAELNLYNAVTVKGGFAVEQSTQTIVISNNQLGNEIREVVQAESLLFGMNNATAFMGVKDGASEGEDFGLSLDNVNMALALLNEKEGSRSWSTVKANIGSASFEGVEGLGLELSETSLLINQSSADGMVVDYHYDDSEAITTYGGSEYRATELTMMVGADAEGYQQTVTFDIDDSEGDLLRVSGRANVQLFGVLEVESGFAFEQSSQVVVISSNETTDEVREVVQTDMITLGLYNASGFVGVRGPDNSRSDDDTGLAIDGVNLGVAVMNERHSSRHWITARANIDSAAFTGIEGIEMSVTAAGVVLNRASDDGMVVDYHFSNEEVELTRPTINQDSYHAFSESERGVINSSYQSVYDADTDQTTIQLVSDLNVQFELFDYVDTTTGESHRAFAHDGKIYLLESTVNSEETTKESEYLTAKSGNTRHRVLSDSVLEGKKSTLYVYKTLEWSIVASFDSAGSQIISYAATELSVQMGSDEQGITQSITFDIDDTRGDLIQVVGHVSINLYNALTLEGGFALESFSQMIVVSSTNSDQREALLSDVMTFGLHDVDAFVGVRGNDENSNSEDTGFVMEGLNLGLAFFTESAGDRRWMSAQGQLDLATFLGVDELEVSVTNGEVLINKAAEDGTVVDYHQSDDEEAITLSVLPESLNVQLSQTELKFLRNQFSENFTHEYDSTLRSHVYIDNETGTHYSLEQKFAKKVGNALTSAVVTVYSFTTNEGDTYEVMNTKTKNITWTGGTKRTDSWDLVRKIESIPASLETVSFTHTILDLTTGVESNGVEYSLSFDMDDNIGDTLRVAGRLTLNAFGILELEGGFAFEQRQVHTVTENTVSGERQAFSAQVMSFGMKDAVGFIGLRGSDNDNTSDDSGLNISGVDMALAIFKNSDSGQANLSLSASIGTAEILGIPGLTVELESAQIEINQANASGEIIDYVYSEGEGVPPALTDVSQEELNSTIEAYREEYSAAIKKGTAEPSEALTNLIDKMLNQTTDIYTIEGEINEAAKTALKNLWIDIFTGSSKVRANSLINNLIKRLPTQAEVNEAVASQAHAVEGTLEATTLTVGLGAGPDGEQGFLTFNFDDRRGELLQVGGRAELDLFGVVKVNGGFGLNFIKDRTTFITDTTTQIQSETTTDIMTFGMTGVNAVVGFDQNTADESDDIGLKFGDVNLALALVSDQNSDRRWSSVYSEIGSAVFVGLDMDAEIFDAALLLNRAASDGTVMDYALTEGSADIGSTELSVYMGVDEWGDTQFTNLGMDGHLGEQTQISGSARFAIAGAISIEGSFALETKDHQSVILSDGSSIDTGLFTIAIQNAQIFAGSVRNVDVEGDDIGLRFSNVDVALAVFSDNASSRSWSALQANGSAAFVGMDSLTANINSANIVLNKAASDHTVVDFKAMDDLTQGFGVFTGLDELGRQEFVEFDMDGAKGEWLQVQGNLTLEVSNFVYLSGDFALEFSEMEATLYGGESVDADLFTLGLSNVNVFAGLNREASNEMGIHLNNVDLALALISEKNGAKRDWLSLRASANSAALVMPGSIPDLNILNAGIEINQSAEDGSVVDYSQTELIVAVSETESTTFDMTGESLAVSGDMSLTLGDFLSVEGHFALEMGQKTMQLSNGEEMRADVLFFGVDHANLFAGVNHGQSNELGLFMEDAYLGVALVSGVYGNAQRSWTSVQAGGKEISLRGINSVTVKGEDIDVAYNSVDAGVSIDYAATSDKFQFGERNMDLAHSGIEISGSLEIAVSDFFRASGTVEMDTTIQTITLDDGSQTTVDMFAIRSYNLNAFAGVNAESENRTGFVLSDTNFAYVSMLEQGGAGREWSSLQASVEEVGFVGADITASGQNISVNINEAASDGSVVDYAAMQTANRGLNFSKEINGNSETISMTIDGQYGSHIELAGTLKLNLFNFVDIEQDFKVRLRYQNVTLTDGSTTSVAMLSFDRSDIDLKVGVGDVGFQALDVDFALAILSDGTHTWASAMATSQTVGFTGVTGLTAEVNAMELLVNTGAITTSGYDGGLAIDYSQGNVQMSNDITFGDNMNQERYRISGDLQLEVFGILEVNGTVAFDKTTEQLQLLNGESVEVDAMTMSTQGLDAFIGVGSVGLELTGVDFALSMLEAKDGSGQWIALQASVFQAGFVGVAGLGIQGNDLKLSYNKIIKGSTGIDLIASEYDAGGQEFIFNRSNAMHVQGEIALDLFGFYKTTGEVSFEQSFSTVTYADGSTGDVGILSIGGSIDRAFVGVNEGTDNEKGFALEDGGFGVAVAVDMNDSSQVWVTAQASAEYVGAIGFDDLTMKVEGAELVINTASQDGRVIDYAAQSYDVPAGLGFSGAGTGNGIAYTLDAKGVETIGVDIGYGELDIAGYVQVIGSMNIQKGETITVDLSVDKNILELIGDPETLAKTIWSSIKENLSGVFSGATGWKDIMAVVNDAMSAANGNAGEMFDIVTELLQGVDFSVIKDVQMDTFTIGASNVNVFAGVGGYFVDANNDGRYYRDYYVDDQGQEWLPDDQNEKATGFVLDNVAFGLGLFSEVDGSGSYTALKLGTNIAGLVGFDNFDMQARDIEVAVNTDYKQTSIDFAASFEDEGGFSIPAGGSSSILIDFNGGKRVGVSVGQAQINVGGFLSLSGSFAFEQGATQTVNIDTGLGDIANIADDLIEAVGLDAIIDDLANGSSFNELKGVQVSTMTIGASNIQAFIGSGGPYLQDLNWDEDSDGDGNVYNDYFLNPNAVGLAMEDVDFGMVLMSTETPGLDLLLDEFQAIKVTAGSVGMVGTGEDINNNGIIDEYALQDLNANGVQDENEEDFIWNSEDRDGNGKLDYTVKFQGRDLSFQYNNGPKWLGLLGPATVNFASTYENFTEDSNGNGILDDGEDLNSDGVINTGGFAIPTGNDVVYIDYEGASMRADVGFAEFAASDFLTLRGGFSFTQATNQAVTLNTGDLGALVAPLGNAVGGDTSKIEMDMDMMIISATNVYGFAGINGEADQDNNNDGIIDYLDGLPDDAIGLTIQDADLSVAMLTPSLAQIPGLASFMPSFLTVKTDVKYGGLVGTEDFLSANVQDLEVNVNTMLPPTALMSTPAGASVYATALAIGALPNVNWAESLQGEDTNNNFILDEGENLNGLNEMGEAELNRGFLTNPNGGDPFFLDFDSEIIEIKGYAEFAIAGAIQLSGGFSIGKTIEEITLMDAISGTEGQAQAVTLSLAVVDAYGFIADPVSAGIQNAVRTSLYGYEPNYWKDVNGDGKITSADGGTHIDHPIIGLAVEDFDFGLVLMRQMGSAQWDDVSRAAEIGLNIAGGLNVYVGMTASLGSVELTGLPGITLSAQNFELNLNASLNPLISVDFSKSGDGRQGFVFDIAAGVELDMSHINGLMFSVQGQAEADILDMVGLNGSFAFSFDKDGMSAFFDAEAYVTFIDGSVHVQGVMGINEDGIALQTSLNFQAGIDGVFELSGELAFAMNTMGKDYVYAIPENLQELVGQETLIVSATPPKGTQAVDAYLAIYGEGHLDILNGSMAADGEFGFVLSLDGTTVAASLYADASIHIGDLMDADATGSLTIEIDVATGKAGLFGSLEVSGGIGGEAFSIDGDFLLQINTTQDAKKALGLKRDDDGEVIGRELVDIPPQYFYLTGSVNIQLFDKVKIAGSVEIELDFANGRYYGALEATVNLGSLGYATVAGELLIQTPKSGQGFAIAGRVTAEVAVGNNSIGIKATGDLSFNTSSSSEFLGLPTQSFHLTMAGEASLLIFKTKMRGELYLSNNEFYVSMDATLKLGPVDATFSGFLSSSGEFSFEAHATTKLNLGFVRLNGGIHLKIDNHGFEGSIDGSIKVGIGKVSITLGVEASLELKDTYVEVSLGAYVQILGKNVGLFSDFKWRFASANRPELAFYDNGVLELNADREGVHYEISSIQDGLITVSDGENEQTFGDVDSISFSGTEGKDYIRIDESVNVDVQLYGGGGDDTFYIYGGTALSEIYGDDGDDLIVTGAIGMSHWLGRGNDKFQGGTGDDLIFVDGGYNIIKAGEGYDRIILDDEAIDSSREIAFGDHVLAHNGMESHFDDQLERVELQASNKDLKLSTSYLGREVLSSSIASITDSTALYGLVSDSRGNVYVSAPEDESIYVISPDGTRRLFAGNPDAPAKSNSLTGDKLVVSFERQFGMAFNTDESKLFVVDKDDDRIRVIDMSTGEMSTFYRFNSWNHSNKNGPIDLTLDDQGNLYVAVWNDDGSSVYKVDANGKSYTRLAKDLDNIRDIEFHDGQLFVVEAGKGRILQYSTDGTPMGTVVDALVDPGHIAFDISGNLLFNDAGTGNLSSINLTTGERQIVAGALGNSLRGLTLQGDQVFVADIDTNRVIKLDLKEGMNYGSTGLFIGTEGAVDVQGVQFSAPGGALEINSSKMLGNVDAQSVGSYSSPSSELAYTYAQIKAARKTSKATSFEQPAQEELNTSQSVNNTIYSVAPTSGGTVFAAEGDDLENNELSTSPFGSNTEADLWTDEVVL